MFYESVAETATVALARISADNGQPASASSAACAKAGVVAVRHRAVRLDLRVDDLMALALDLVHRDDAADSSRSGGVPAFVSSLASDIVKHAPWAAASSSSGLVFPSGLPIARRDGVRQAR